MIGRRLPDNLTEWEAGQGPVKGDYWKTVNGWMCCTHDGSFGNLSKHSVVEHEDGTITVSPSILVSTTSPNKGNSVELWHGYLERGIWRSV